MQINGRAVALNQVFYGWWVLAGLIFIYTASNGILIATLPVLYPSMMAEVGVTAAQMTLPATLCLLASAVLSPFGGVLLDRQPPRIVMAVGIAIMLAGLAVLPAITALWQVTVIFVAFAFGLAAGGLLPSMVILTRWFVRNRGVAAGLLLMSSSLGGALFPLLIRDALTDEGWRSAVYLMTVAGGAMMILPLVWLVRGDPRDKGLVADGDAAPVDAARAPTAIAQVATLRDAVRSADFYLLAFATGVLWFCFIGVLQHQSIYLGRDLGVSSETLPLVFSVFFWFAMIGKALFGVLSDWFKKTHIMLLAIVNLGVGLILLRLIDADTPGLIYVYAAVYGAGYSGAFTMIQLMIAEFFAGPSYGKILGLFVMIDTLAGALGTRVLGDLRDGLGSYAPAFNLMIALCVIAGACVLVLDRRQASAAPLPQKG